ncbi:general substrate transporter [Vararia minispora EC-137]|uniref:General substrate transporter n=1 Tax=Vararia minispora EC-137 TaxID=1314806 RepID=A0ACB8Q9T2_9AGAM|nr:general substrate transporter [Vararia minispora EC-137]
MKSSTSSLTVYGWLVCAWALIASFQYGYHISALNQIQAVLTCREILPSQTFGHMFSTCIPISNSEFSIVTSIFTVGGLVGSLYSDYLQDRFGRKGALQLSAGFTALGAGFSSIASEYGLLLLGRTFVGVGSGIGLCVCPIFLSEVSPSKIRDSVGVLTQFAIVIGIMITQLIGLRFATPTQWRLVPAASCLISIVQLLLSPAIVETPEWLGQHHMNVAATSSERAIWTVGLKYPQQAPDIEAPLLDEAPSPLSDRPREREESVSLLRLFFTPRLRRPLVIVCVAMISQQVSGAILVLLNMFQVLYYSNDILSKSLPELGPYISLGITVVNVLMTFPPIILIERMGRKRLLLVSIGGLLFSLLLVGVGLNARAPSLSSIAITTFVMSFAIGLGPVPFVMIPEVSPPEAVAALSSIALSVNWITNFLVGLTFLPLRNFLSGGKPDQEGRVFFVFVGALGLFSSVLFRAYRS